MKRQVQVNIPVLVQQIKQHPFTSRHSRALHQQNRSDISLLRPNNTRKQDKSKASHKQIIKYIFKPPTTKWSSLGYDKQGNKNKSLSRPRLQKLPKFKIGLQAFKSIQEGQNTSACFQNQFSRSPPISINTKLSRLSLHQNFPMPSSQFLSSKGQKLTQQERSQLLTISTVYYIGASSIPTNDEISLRSGDHIQYRFQIQKLIGTGSFSYVFKVFDHKFKYELAMKILKNEAKFAKHSQKEVYTLQLLNSKNSCQNVIKMVQTFEFRSHTVIFTQCITFQLFSGNLFELIKGNWYRGLEESVVKEIARDILKGIKHIHKTGLVHCDLKPQNIMLVKPKEPPVVIIDFGSSFFPSQKSHHYIQSRYYRAPEVILGQVYSQSIDIWSFGAILVELFTGRPLFPGKSESDQLQCISEVLGVSFEELVQNSSRKASLLGKPLQRIHTLPPLHSVLNGTSKEFTQFIGECLALNPNERLTAEEALRHDWLKSEERGRFFWAHKRSLTDLRGKSLL